MDVQISFFLKIFFLTKNLGEFGCGDHQSKTDIKTYTSVTEVIPDHR